jgi:flagellar basal-body rod protein FlgC
MDDLFGSMRVSASGMRAQGTRLRIISENIANADSAASSPDAAPYRRKVVTFRNALDRSLGVETVKVDRVGHDPKGFEKRFDPGHPAADGDGYVSMPNVNSLIEMMDMREAQRSYEANLSMIRGAREMAREALDVLR